MSKAITGDKHLAEYQYPYFRCTKCRRILPVEMLAKGKTWCKSCRNESARNAAQKKRQDGHSINSTDLD